MAQEGFKRKLTTIFSADAVGYSRLMEDDEEATVSTLTTYREVIVTLIKQHNGIVVDSPGDNLLAEFVSVVDAVQCAVSVQNEINVRNEDLPENRKMQFRIGINLGDVIQEGERIYGDGVNIAARLEGLADPGGICISKTAFDQIERKLPYGYEFIGDQTVKNISKPVGAYRVMLQPRVTVAGEPVKEKSTILRRIPIIVGALAVLALAFAVGIWQFYMRRLDVEPASVEKMAFPLPEKPSIAILPFENLTGDPDQEYLADGITETIITSLSKVPHLFVITGNSTFIYKGKSVKVHKVSEDLGVKYVLEGSVQKSGDKLRLTVQFVDALAGNHLWAERYDRELKDIFAVQDEIAIKIMTAMQVNLTEGDMAHMISRCTENVDAYVKILKGRVHLYRFSREGMAMARQMYEEAVTLDPNNPCAWGYLAWTHFNDARYGFTESRAESIRKAEELSQKALSLDEEHGANHSLLGFIYLFQRKYEKAMAESERALSLDPNNAAIHALYGGVMLNSGRFDEAVSLTKKAMRLNPYYPTYYLNILGQAYTHLRRYDDAITIFKKHLDRTKGKFASIWSLVGLAWIYSELGRDDEAQAHVEEVFKLKPDVSLEYFRRSWLYKDPVHVERRLDALRRVGVPETPPLPLPDRPSIAVLPFVNMSGDPEQEYFSDGLTEEIIAALSSVPKLFVIARNSTFTYKGKPVKVQQVSEELGVRYVLEGSVRKSGDEIRITAQLVDAINGHHLWAERYDRNLNDIFAIQDEISKKIISAMQVKLTEGEGVRVAAKGTNNLQAYLKYLQAKEFIYKQNPEDNALAKKLAEEAVALDPEYASAFYIQSNSHLLEVWLGTSKSPKASMAKAMQLLQKAIFLNAAYADAHALLGWLFCMTRQYDKALAHGEKAVVLNPNSAESHMRYGKILTQAGKYQESIPELETAIRLNPIPPTIYLYSLGIPYCLTGQYEQAITWCEKAVREEPNALFARLFMAWIYSSSGRDQEARIEAAEVVRIHPKFSLEKFAKSCALKDKIQCERMVSALRRAGLK